MEYQTNLGDFLADSLNIITILTRINRRIYSLRAINVLAYHKTS